MAKATPELVRLAELEVRIPRIECSALEHVVVRDVRSIDAVIAGRLEASLHYSWTG